jgi:hypothetical protein
MHVCRLDYAKIHVWQARVRQTYIVPSSLACPAGDFVLSSGVTPPERCRDRKRLLDRSFPEGHC